MSLSEAKAVKGIAQTVASSSGIVLAGNFVLNFILSASLQQVWSLIESQ